MGKTITANSRKIDMWGFNESDVDIRDIAHHLANTFRFGGILPLGKRYSVAQHSINMCEYVLNNRLGVDLAAACLMHDASEAYLGDIVTGVKSLLPDYKALEAHVQNIITTKYKVPNSDYLCGLVDKLDKRILLTESYTLCNYDQFLYIANNLPAGLDMLEGIKIKSNVNPTKVYRRFMSLASNLLKL